MGLRFLCIAGGAGRRNWRLHCWVCTPHRKIRIQFQGNKHTSLNLTVHESLGASALLGSENDHRNVCRKALETVVLYSEVVAESAMKQGRGIGGVSRHTSVWLAWALCALSLALTALSLLLFILNLSYPNTHLYEPWLDNTLTAVFYPSVGAIVASRRPENPVGWLLCLYGLGTSIGYFCAEYAIYALLAQPNSLPAGEAMAWIVSWVLPILNGLQVFYILLFPTGRLPSRRWRWLGWLTVAFVVVGVILAAFSSGALMGFLGPIQNPLGIEGFSNIYYKAVLFTMASLLTLAAALAVFIRLRRAIGVERQQIKWFAHGHTARPLLLRHRRVAESLRGPQRPRGVTTTRGRGLHPPDRCPVYSLEATHPVVHRPALLQNKVRCQEDPGRLLFQAQKRDRPEGIERRPGRSSEGDDAASPRLAVVATRYDSEGRADTLGIILFT